MGDADSIKFKLLSLLYDLRELKALGKHGCLVEGNSKVVVGWALGLGEGSWSLLHNIHEVQEIIREMGAKMGKLINWLSGIESKLFVIKGSLSRIGAKPLV